jgi:hypothetical protein
MRNYNTFRNAYSLLNAAFVLDCDGGAGNRVITAATAVFGALGDRPPVSCATLDLALRGHSVSALAGMATELAEVAKKDAEKHAWFAVDEHTDYRVRLVQAFVQKFATSFTLGAEVVSLHRVGARKSKHAHTFPKTATAPHEKMYVPHIKTTALIQTTGKAQFTDDLPILPGSAHAVMVPMPFANALFRGLDISKAQSELGADFLGILTEGKLREAKLPTDIDWRKACGEFQGPFAAKKKCDEPVFLAAGERSHYAGNLLNG